MRARSIGIVIEIKYTDGPDLEKGCQEALLQIKEKDLKEGGLTWTQMKDYGRNA